MKGRQIINSVTCNPLDLAKTTLFAISNTSQGPLRPAPQKAAKTHVSLLTSIPVKVEASHRKASACCGHVSLTDKVGKPAAALC